MTSKKYVSSEKVRQFRKSMSVPKKYVSSEKVRFLHRGVEGFGKTNLAGGSGSRMRRSSRVKYAFRTAPEMRQSARRWSLGRITANRLKATERQVYKKLTVELAFKAS